MTGKWITDGLTLTALAAMLAGCAYVKPSSVDPEYMGLGSFSDTYSKPGTPATDAGLITFGNSKQKSDTGGAGIGVNAYLWRGALDTLSFLPLTSADPFGGVIITDW